jgi:syntaxin-binding protein 5
LLVTQESGLTRVFEVANVGGSWHISSQPVPVAHDSARGAVASFVIDKAGDELLADAQRLQLSQAYQGQALDASGAPASLWVVATRTSASCYYNVDGPKIAEYVDERERFEKAVIVHQQGCAALIVQSRSCAMYTFSLPDLQQVSRMKFETTLQYVSPFSIFRIENRSLTRSLPSPLQRLCRSLCLCARRRFRSTS